MTVHTLLRFTNTLWWNYSPTSPTHMAIIILGTYDAGLIGERPSLEPLNPVSGRLIAAPDTSVTNLKQRRSGAAHDPLDGGPGLRQTL